MRPSQFALALFLLISPLLYGQTSDPAAFEAPRFWSIDNFGHTGPGRTPTELKLSAADEEALMVAYAAIPATPRYLYSGCHDRAHAIYLLLPTAIKPRLMKIWVMTPSVYTEAISGHITSTRTDPGDKDIFWGYHVALAFRSADGSLKVLDPALEPGHIVTQGVWFQDMKTPPLTLWTLTDGSVYLFYNNDVGANPSDWTDRFAMNGRDWNGNSFTYSGDSVTNGYIPEALARDAIGEDMLKGTACPSLVSIGSNATALLSTLRKGPTNGLEPACQTSFMKFENEKARWTTLLAGK